MRLVQNDHAGVSQWVAQRIDFVRDYGFGPCTAIGVLGLNDKPLCGVVFHDYQPRFKTISFSIAADSPKWATRNVIKGLFSYPFVQLGIEKLWTTTPHKNERALRMLKFTGFTQEATLARQFGDQHAIVNRMFRDIYFKRYGDA